MNLNEMKSVNDSIEASWWWSVED